MSWLAPAAERGRGLCNTHFWVDRSTGVNGAIHSQTLPFVAGVCQVYLDFETALYPAL